MRQQTMKRAMALAWCAVAAAALTACGGGGSPPASADAPKAADTPVRTAVTLSGVVATGAAFAEATVSVTDRTGAVVRDLLFDLNRASGTTMVLVTHDLDFAARCDRVLHLHEGRLREDPASHRKPAHAVSAESGVA